MVVPLTSRHALPEEDRLIETYFISHLYALMRARGLHEEIFVLTFMVYGPKAVRYMLSFLTFMAYGPKAVRSMRSFLTFMAYGPKAVRSMRSFLTFMAYEPKTMRSMLSFLKFMAYGPNTVRSMCHERQNKYFSYGRSTRLIRALMYACTNKLIY